MSSLALYRRYRPDTFAEVIGQEHVTGPLQQALRNNRVNHAYLFSGPRGCGKTTSARILARCLNCVQGPTPTPCGECQSCRDLARNGPGSIDVIEIDAASHGGVDDARELREKAFFGPASSRYKIYIIDEAHMVTTQGFNALLKVVEEPPEHLKFIFATTEPEKVIGTIRSRTHHYPFRLVPPGTLRDYLADVCEREAIPVEEGVLPLVVRAGAGSVRDSMSVMDQLLAGAGEDGVTYAMATALLGYTDGSLLDAVVDAFAASDGRAAFEVVDRVIEGGNDPRRFVADLLERLRDLVVLSAVPDAAEKGLIDAPADVIERMQAQASRFGAAELSRAADLVNEGLTEMRGATAPRLQLELICARVLLPAAFDDERSVQARLERLERGAAAGGLPGAAGPAMGYVPSPDAHAVRPGPTGAAAARAALPGRGNAGTGGPAEAGAPQAPAEPQASSLASEGPDAGRSPTAQPGADAAASAQPGGAALEGGSAQTAGGPPDVSAEGGSAEEQRPGTWPAGAQPKAAGGAAPQARTAQPDASGDAGSAAPSRPGAWPTGTTGTARGQGGAPQPGAGAGLEGAGAQRRTGTGSQPGGQGMGEAPPHRPGDWPEGGRQPGSSGAAAQAAPAAPAAAPGTAQGAAGMVQGAAQIRQMWPDILEEVKNRRRFTWILLSQNAQVAGFDGTTLRLGFSNAGARDSFVGGGSEDVLRQALSDRFGVQWKVEAVVDPSGGGGAPGGQSGPGFGGGSGGSRPSAPRPAPQAPSPARPTGPAPAAPSQSSPTPRPSAPDARANRGPVPSAPVALEDDMPAEDDPDLDDTALSGHDLIVRELGATVVEEYNE
ncbi:DNA polymerase III subunit gamma and tau [Streptomyces sp. KR80]|uniref:DNA polymerase III subunit gamma and tau n=1 Tax=Streptomyces sp. KR80 TaxID=3457426 RepID=UPI003FD3CF17